MNGQTLPFSERYDQVVPSSFRHRMSESVRDVTQEWWCEDQGNTLKDVSCFLPHAQTVTGGN
jgi:hypothetical protein